MDPEEFEEQLAALEAQLGTAQSVTAAFDAELQSMNSALVMTGREVDTLSRGIGTGLRRAFDGLAFDGMRLSDALRQVAASMVDSMYNIAMRPVQEAVGGAIARGLEGIMPFADGGSFAQGRVMPFADGGIVSGATAFPRRGGAMGLMGEAGPEAIMPLSRGPDGKLGVRAREGGAAAPQVVMNISTNDVEGFRRSQSQIAAQMGRALARGQRNR